MNNACGRVVALPCEVAGRRVADSRDTDARGHPGTPCCCRCASEGVRTSRRYHRLLGLFGTLGSDGRPRINGHPWDGPEPWL